MKLKNQVALITGAAQGIGRAIAILFAKEGAKIAVNDINREGGDQTVTEIRKAGGEAVFVFGDVSKSVDVEKMVNATVKSYGKLNILVNNAAVDVRGLVTEMPEEVWDRTMDVIAKGTFLCTKYAIPEMIKQGGGSIVNIVSQSAFSVSYGSCAYCASKAAQLNLTKSTAWDYGSKNIRANAICPGPIKTDLMRRYLETFKDPALAEHIITLRTPLHKWGTTEDVARLALYLASDESSFMTGAALIIDGGETAGIVTYQPPDFEPTEELRRLNLERFGEVSRKLEKV